MLDFANYIKTALSQNNAVVIPNLGSFEWLYIPAKLNLLEHHISAPAYTLSFNQKQQQDKKELLAQLIAQKQNISLDAAKEQLVNFRLQVESSLAQEAQLYFPGLGQLKKQENGEWIFVQDELIEGLINPAHGLVAIDAMPILRDKRSNKTATLGYKTKRNLRPIFIWGSVGVVALVFFISIPFWWSSIFGANPSANTNSEMGEENNANSEISILPVMMESQEKLLELIAAYENAPLADNSQNTSDNNNNTEPVTNTDNNNNSETTSETPITPEPKETPKKEEPQPKKEEPKVNNTPSSDEVVSGDYIIVIGVFGDAGNVARNEQRLRDAGYRVQVKKLYTGYTRVAALVDAASKEDLQQKWAEIRQKFTPKAWVAKQ